MKLNDNVPKYITKSIFSIIFVIIFIILAIFIKEYSEINTIENELKEQKEKTELINKSQLEVLQVIFNKTENCEEFNYQDILKLKRSNCLQNEPKN